MAFASFTEGAGSQPMAEINTTPLVDVMLVLLVIFIITAPLFHQAVQIDLPRVDSTKIDEKPLVLQVALTSSGGLLLNGAPIGRDALALQFAEVSHSRPMPTEMHLRADRATPYERVADVMALAQRSGIEKIAFVTEPGLRSKP